MALLSHCFNVRWLSFFNQIHLSTNDKNQNWIEPLVSNWKQSTIEYNRMNVKQVLNNKRHVNWTESTKTRESTSDKCQQRN